MGVDVFIFEEVGAGGRWVEVSVRHRRLALRLNALTSMATKHGPTKLAEREHSLAGFGASDGCCCNALNNGDVSGEVLVPDHRSEWVPYVSAHIPFNDRSKRPLEMD